MRYIVFSDIHSNLEAANIFFSTARRYNPDIYLCLGDTVGYGANPNECLSLVREIKAVNVAGNHEWGVLSRLGKEWFNEAAFKAILWTKDNLTSENFSFIREFPLLYEGEDFVCTHSSLYNPARFNYVTDKLAARTLFSLLKKKICFIGHTHRPEVYAYYNNEIGRITSRQVKLMPGFKYIVNAGSVGQPRDGDSRLCFCFYDSKESIVIFERIKYNIKQTQKKILDAGLPPFLAQRLRWGR